MNPFFTFIHSWLLGGLTYPALTFVITAAMKSTRHRAHHLERDRVSAAETGADASVDVACLQRGAALSVLLWALAPRLVDSWRMNVHVYPTPDDHAGGGAGTGARSSREGNAERAKPLAAATAPLLAYTAAARPEVPLATMRVPWMERIEQIVFHGWWSVALLLLAWRAFRAVCGHFWLRKNSKGF
jgi:hypothetical protein